MSITISKTDYLIWRECPKNAWLKIHKPEIYYSSELSSFEKSIIERGNEVETEARKLFPTGVLIEGRDQSSQRETWELISRSEKTLFQPVFERDSFLAASDVIQFNEKVDKYSLFEIKATNSIKEKEHFYDLAFQTVLLKKAGVDIDRINLIHLNPKYIRNGDLEITKLFQIDDVTTEIEDMIGGVAKEMDRALKYLSSTDEPAGPCSCVYKGKSSHCTTFSYSNPHIPEYSVHNIARIGVSKSKLTELIDGNIFKVEEVPEHIELSEIQQNQVNTAITGRPIIKKDKIIEELSGLIFPLYFLDYETFPCAIPRFDGFSPYQQIPFQYSLHVMEKPITDQGLKDDDQENNSPEICHKEFLHSENTDPTIPFYESLKKDIGKIGTIIVWNKKFECKINQELAKRLPEAKPFIDDLNSRVYDLMDIFSKQYYVHRDFMGSTSIKYVLPVLAPQLSYTDLEIREGGTASQKWQEMISGIGLDGPISPEERIEIANNLKKYCERDTYAMFEIWRRLFKI